MAGHGGNIWNCYGETSWRATSLGPRLRQEVDIKIDFGEVGFGCVACNL